MSRTPASHDLTRRHMLGRSAALLAGMAAGGGVLSVARGVRAATSEVTFQLGWIMSNGQIGEVAGRSLGYFEAEGINLKFAPGGPNVDGVAIVAAGSAQVGNLSSSPSLMLARAGGIPVKCFAVGCQEHPLRTSRCRRSRCADLGVIGKQIGTQGTARMLCARCSPSTSQGIRRAGRGDGQRHGAALDGHDERSPARSTNASALKPLGSDRVDMRLWDAGIQLYANLYYATDDTLQKHGDVLAGFTRAAAKGWASPSRIRRRPSIFW